MIALDDIEDGEVLVEVPEAILMSTRSAARWELAAVLEHVEPTTALCLHLLHERQKGAKSFWAPFIGILPLTYDTTLFYSDDELRELQNEKASADAREARAKVQKLYADQQTLLLTHSKLFPEEHFNFEAFKWAYGVVQTRACYMLINARRGDNSCLVPFADFLNHSNVETDAGYDEKTRTYKITTRQSYKKGQEVFISYGKYGNAPLLALYGFVITGNPEELIYLEHPSIRLHIDALEPDKRLRGKKEKMIDSLPLTRNFFAKWRELSWSFLAIVRIMLMTEPELSRDNIFAAVYEERTDLLRHERRLHQFSADLISHLLSLHPSTIADDQSLLQRPPLPYHLSCAVRLRLGEKLVLASIRDAALEWLQSHPP